MVLRYTHIVPFCIKNHIPSVEAANQISQLARCSCMLFGYPYAQIGFVHLAIAMHAASSDAYLIINIVFVAAAGVQVASVLIHRTQHGITYCVWLNS